MEIPANRIITTTDFRNNLVSILDNMEETRQDITITQDNNVTAILGIKHPGNRFDSPDDRKYVDVIGLEDLQKNMSKIFSCFKGGLAVFKVNYGDKLIYLYRHPDYDNPYDRFLRGVLTKVVDAKQSIIATLELKVDLLTNRISELESIVSNSESQATMLRISDEWRKEYVMLREAHENLKKEAQTSTKKAMALLRIENQELLESQEHLQKQVQDLTQENERLKEENDKAKRVLSYTNSSLTIIQQEIDFLKQDTEEYGSTRKRGNRAAKTVNKPVVDDEDEYDDEDDDSEQMVRMTTVARDKQADDEDDEDYNNMFEDDDE